MKHRILIFLQLIPLAITVEMMVFFSTPVKFNVRFLKRWPVFLLNAKDGTIIGVINTVLYRKPLGLRLLVGNCIRYSLLGYAFLSKRYRGLGVALGVKSLSGTISGHMWLEICNSVVFEPASTGEKYKKLGVFKG